MLSGLSTSSCSLSVSFGSIRTCGFLKESSEMREERQIASIRLPSLFAQALSTEILHARLPWMMLSDSGSMALLDKMCKKPRTSCA